MISILLFAAAFNDQLVGCSTAVHGDLSAAVTVCDTKGQQIDIFSADGPTDACLAALDSGQRAGKYGSKLPVQMRQGLIRDFDKKMAACQSPAPEKHAPERKITNLWD